MNEIKCPNCGKVFQVDEAGYAAIAAQVHTELFDAEVAERVKAVRLEMEARQSAQKKAVQPRVERNLLGNVERRVITGFISAAPDAS